MAARERWREHASFRDTQPMRAGVITAELEAFVDALYDAAQPEHSYPRDAGQPRAYKLDDRVALFFNGQTHTARIATCFEFGGRLRYQLEFEGHGRFALTEGQVKRLEVSPCTAIVPFAPQGTALLVIA